ncbi:MAG: ribonuclease E inhibitor RraB [Crocinitomicaceae bacterium]
MSDKSIQSDINKQMVKLMNNMGDDLSKERPVYHWIYFDTKEDMQKFIAQIIDLDYKVESHFYDENSSLAPYSVIIVKADKVDHEHVDNLSLPLLDLANQYNGFYDGWETPLEI